MMLDIKDLEKYKKEFNLIENKRYGEERALYGLNKTLLNNIRIEGEEDGESALKECKKVILLSSFLDLRYPLWHDEDLLIKDTTLSINTRAALWYSKNIIIKDSKLLGIKGIRECEDIVLENLEISSNEFGWKSSNIKGTNLTIEGEYLFFEGNNIKLDNINFKGKYSFQYINNLEINNSILDTKDAFWHTNNVIVRNSVIKGEYLGWYSNNLTFINCKIIGTQPLCYANNLKLINSEMIDTDLSFEYSDVDASINGDIESIKNVRSGKIIMNNGKIKEIIKTDDSKYPFDCEITYLSK